MKRSSKRKRETSGAKKRAARVVDKPGLRPIHKNIKRLRGERELTFRALGEATGVCPTAVLRWEQGLSAPVASRIPKVADALGVSIDELYAEKAS